MKRAVSPFKARVVLKYRRWDRRVNGFHPFGTLFQELQLRTKGPGFNNRTSKLLYFRYGGTHRKYLRWAHENGLPL